MAFIIFDASVERRAAKDLDEDEATTDEWLCCPELKKISSLGLYGI